MEKAHVPADVIGKSRGECSGSFSCRRVNVIENMEHGTPQPLREPNSWDTLYRHF